MVMIGALLLLLAWMTPLHFLPWVSWHNEVFAFMAVLVLAWQGLFLIARGNALSIISFPVTVLPLIGLITLIGFQLAAGVITFAGDALVFALYIVTCMACMAMGYAASHQQTIYVQLAATLLLGAFISTIIAFVQVFEVWETSPWINRMQQLRRPGGNLGQPNQLATLLLMGLTSLLFLYESKKLGAQLSTLLALILLIGIAATESRTAVLSFIVLGLWWSVKQKTLDFRLSPWAVLLTGMGFLGLFWSWPQLLLDTVQQTTGSGAVVNTNVGSRWQVWPQLLEAALQRPWWGWGMGQVSTAHNAVVHAYASSEPFTYAHNIVLDTALGMGIPLAGFGVVICLVWLWRRMRTVRQLAPWYCLALVLPVAVHSMLEFPFAYAYFLAPVMFALGALEGMTAAKVAFRLGVKPVVAMLFATTAVMAWSVVEYVAIEEDFRVVRFESLRVGVTPSNYERPHVVLLTQLDALLNGGRIQPKSGMLSDELELARKVALRYPWPATQSRYALSLALNGNPDESIRQLKVMRALHGEQTYQGIKASWAELGATRFPQLKLLALP